MCGHVCTHAQVYLCVSDQEQVNMGAWQGLGVLVVNPLGANGYRCGHLMRIRIKNPNILRHLLPLDFSQDHQPRWMPCVPLRRLRFTFKNELILLFLQDQCFQYFKEVDVTGEVRVII